MGQTPSKSEAKRVEEEKSTVEPVSKTSEKTDSNPAPKLSSFNHENKVGKEIAESPSQNKAAEHKIVGEKEEPAASISSRKVAVNKPAQKLPHNYENIIKDVDSPMTQFSSTEELYNHLHSGIFLNQKRKKYWVDKETGANCFMVYARDLLITWSEEKHFWHWTSSTETSDVGVEVAELLNVCWLEIHGKFDTAKLSPKTMYEIVFVVKLIDPAYGWDVPVNIKLVLPDGETKVHKENLLTKPRGQWVEVEVGEFYTSPDKMGEMQFSMFEYEGGKWKKGLRVKGVVIRPKKQP